MFRGSSNADFKQMGNASTDELERSVPLTSSLVGSPEDDGVAPAPETVQAPKSSEPDKTRRAPQELTEEMRRKLAENETQFALNFMRVISVLIRSPRHKHYALSDLEWLIIPPLRTGQCAILNAETPGLQVAAAVALWASVSPEVDQRLSQDLQAPIRLRPDEWRSGEALWLVDAVGVPEAVRQLLSRLKNDKFKDRQVKLRRINNVEFL